MIYATTRDWSSYQFHLNQRCLTTYWKSGAIPSIHGESNIEPATRFPSTLALCILCSHLASNTPRTAKRCKWDLCAMRKLIQPWKYMPPIVRAFQASGFPDIYKNVSLSFGGEFHCLCNNHQLAGLSYPPKSSATWQREYPKGQMSGSPTILPGSWAFTSEPRKDWGFCPNLETNLPSPNSWQSLSGWWLGHPSEK